MGELVPSAPSRVNRQADLSAVIGEDVASGQPIEIGDIERRSGLYVLGIPGMGKSSLLVSLIAQDIQNGHGVFFLDPHGRAIEDLLARYRFNKDIILLDPADETHTFGINLLACDNIKSLSARENTLTRVESIFSKIWAEDYAQGQHFPQVLGHTFPLLIETQYTITEAPLFLKDRGFRQHIYQQISIEMGHLDYWQNFEQMKASAQDELVQPLFNRLDLLLRSHYVQQIVGQKQTTLDFKSVISERKAVFLKLAFDASETAKRFIGTIVMSELLHAVTHRPPGETHQFCIFVDEMQHFVDSQDFAKLITEARKFGVATTLAHQERFGQLEKDRKLAGATLACANKILFQLTVKDAEELAPEIADKPAPAEVRLERQYVISAHPIKDLAQGSHPNEFIRKFSRQYFRPMHYMLEDISDAMEERRLIRMDFFDEAMLFRIEDAMEGLSHRSSRVNSSRQGLLQGAFSAVRSAHGQTRELLALQESKVRIKLTLRGLNEFLTDIMEGTIKAEPGNEEFAQFLVERVHAYGGVPSEYSRLVGLYVLLTYGNPAVKRDVPFAIATNYNLLADQVRPVLAEINRKTQEAVEECRKELAYRVRSSVEFTLKQLEVKRKEEIARVINDNKEFEYRGYGGAWKDRFSSLTWEPRHVYLRHIWMSIFPEIRELLAPFENARFADAVDFSRWETELFRSLSYVDRYDDVDDYYTYVQYMRADVVRDIQSFFLQKGESGFVLNWLMDRAGFFGGSHIDKIAWLKGIDPCDIYVHLRGLSDCLCNLRDRYSSDYLDRLHRPYFISPSELRLRNNLSYQLKKYFTKKQEWGRSDEWLMQDIKSAGYHVSISGFNKPLSLGKEYGRFLSTAEALLAPLKVAERDYVLSKVACRNTYGEERANLQFPSTKYNKLVCSLVSLGEKEQLAALQDTAKKVEERERRFWGEAYDKKVAKISFPPPAVLSAQTLLDGQIAALKDACLREFSKDPEIAKTIRKALKVIDDFVQFCRLLSVRENWLMRGSSVYADRVLATRPAYHMESDKAQEISRLNFREAYVKLMHFGGSEGVLLRKMKTLDLPAEPRGMDLARVRLQKRFSLDQARARYCKSRSSIESEIRERQTSWRQELRGSRPRSDSTRRPVIEHGEEPPPPTSS